MNQRNNRLQTFSKLVCGLFVTLPLLPPLLSSVSASTSTGDNSLSFVTSNNRTDTRCPDNYYHSGIDNVCIVDSLNVEVVNVLPTNKQCQTGYEKIIGTQFCTMKNHFVTADQYSYLVAGAFGEFCPENFSRPPESQLCLDKRLSLIEEENELKLVAPTGDSEIPPDEAVGLFAAPPIDCEPGFIKPPGFHFCIANSIAANAEPKQFEFDIPIGRCPENWARKKTNGFCLPVFNLHICGKELPCQNLPGDSFVISSRPLDCPEGYLQKQTNVPSYDRFNIEDFTIIPTYACVPPDKNVDPM